MILVAIVALILASCQISEYQRTLTLAVFGSDLATFYPSGSPFYGPELVLWRPHWHGKSCVAGAYYASIYDCPILVSVGRQGVRFWYRKMDPIEL